MFGSNLSTVDVEGIVWNRGHLSPGHWASLGEWKENFLESNCSLSGLATNVGSSALFKLLFSKYIGRPQTIKGLVSRMSGLVASLNFVTQVSKSKDTNNVLTSDFWKDYFTSTGSAFALSGLNLLSSFLASGFVSSLFLELCMAGVQTVFEEVSDQNPNLSFADTLLKNSAENLYWHLLGGAGRERMPSHSPYIHYSGLPLLKGSTLGFGDYPGLDLNPQLTTQVARALENNGAVGIKGTSRNGKTALALFTAAALTKGDSNRLLYATGNRFGMKLVDGTLKVSNSIGSGLPRMASFAELNDYFQRQGNNPGVLILDELVGANEDVRHAVSREVLEALQGRYSNLKIIPVYHFVEIGAFNRHYGFPDDHPLSFFNPVPLSETDILTYLRQADDSGSLNPSDIPDLARLLFQETGGHPFLLGQILGEVASDDQQITTSSINLVQSAAMSNLGVGIGSLLQSFGAAERNFLVALAKNQTPPHLADTTNIELAGLVRRAEDGSLFINGNIFQQHLKT